MKKIIFVLFLLTVISSFLFAQGPIAPTPPAIPSLTVTIGGTPTASQLSTTLLILIILTVITLAPSLLILMTSFTRIIVVFSLLRSAMATQQAPSNQILIGLALFMTFFIMQPVFTNAYDNALVPYINGKIGYQEAIEKGLDPFREFMYSEIVKHKDESSILVFTSYRNMPAPKNLSDVPTSILIPAFVLSELTIAFKIGVLLYIPFILIDMIVASILLSLGMIMIPPVMISLPFKLLLFVLVGGWNLVVSGILHSF